LFLRYGICQFKITFSIKTKVSQFALFLSTFILTNLNKYYLYLMNTTKTKVCSGCESSFSCGDISAEEKCWCNDFPPIFNLADGGDCLCPVCFKEACEDKIDAYIETLTPEKAINNKAATLPKTEKLIEGIDYYIENEKYVFKSWFHLKRGSCCENGCRHCPY